MLVQGGEGGWLPPREWDLERPAMDLLPTSLMCPVEELLARAAAGEALRPLDSREIEQVSCEAWLGPDTLLCVFQICVPLKLMVNLP